MDCSELKQDLTKDLPVPLLKMLLATRYAVRRTNGLKCLYIIFKSPKTVDKGVLNSVKLLSSYHLFSNKACQDVCLKISLEVKLKVQISKKS